MDYDCELYEWIMSARNDGTVSIVGRILNDSKNRFQDHEIVCTSQVFSIDFNNNIAITNNTVYKLIHF